MRRVGQRPRARSLPAPLGAAAAALLTLGLLFASPASAAYEETGVFAGVLEAPAEAGKFPEEMQLGNTGGIAVNYTGAGGVAAGTLYAATVTTVGGLQVARYEPSGESMSFVESWQVRSLEGPYERCGPLLGTSCPPQPGAAARRIDVDVDQSTGNVYVLYEAGSVPAGTRLIVEYSPDGSKEITRFGEVAESGKTTAETPSQIHASNSGGIAVNAAGEVYVFDLNNPDNFYHRLMVFKPQSPGDYEHYAYAGEFAAGIGVDGTQPGRPATDAAGHIYVTDEGSVDEFAAETPAAYPGPHSVPLCHFEYPKEGITSIAVNPTGGEPFFFSYKKGTGPSGLKVKLIHQLGPCNETTGKFEAGGQEEIGTIEVRPERAELYGMAYDPVRKLSAGRPAGVLYAAAPSGETELGTGGEPALHSLGYIFAPATGAAKFKLTVTKSGTGKGSVISTPVGVFCGTTFCSAEFESGKEVELKAKPEAGSGFVKWIGACSGTGVCKVTMSEAKAVTAEFGPAKPKFKLTVSKSGSGSGTVTSSPAGITCGTGANCEAEYEEGTEVTLAQAAASGSEFKEWSGACTGSGACKVTMSAAKAVGAVFTPIPRTLSITKAGTGTGEVKCKFNGGSAGACTSPQPNGTAVEVLATANPGSSFAAYSAGTGSASACATSPCSFTLEANSALTATFTLNAKPKFKLTVSKPGSGSGTVTAPRRGSTAARAQTAKPNSKKAPK